MQSCVWLHDYLKSNAMCKERDRTRKMEFALNSKVF
jgi:hypothetical protein